MTRIELCLSCHGSGEAPCEDCGGVGTDCHTCEDTGVVKCPNCDGDGDVVILDEYPGG